MSELDEILERFLKLESVRATVLLDPLGSVIAETGMTEESFQDCVGVVAGLIPIAVNISGMLESQAVQQQYVETEDVQLTVELLQGDYALVVIANPGANLGRIRLEMRKSKAPLESLVSVG